MIDKQWLQRVQDGKTIIAQLDKGIFEIRDEAVRDIILARFEKTRSNFDYDVTNGSSSSLGSAYRELVDISLLVNELR